ncbi:LPXTG cell wall anchor domain-containing protein [Streptococcus suis]|nr:LPXTG cell wall anchor domain-containing protein [Streptococcus suis]
MPEVPVVESLPSPEPEAPILEAPVAPAEVIPEVTAEPVAPEAPAAPEVEVPVERQAGIVYHASYVEETTKEEVGKGKPQATIVTTTEEKASAEVTVTADYLPKGYELSDPAKTSVTATVHEGQANPVAFSVRPVAVPETKVVTEGYTGLRATVPPAADGQVDQPTDGADATTYKGAEHFKNYDAADMTKIKKQITWLDFSDASWTGLDRVNGSPALVVGATYKKEIAPGYVVEITVSELKPFESTDVYRDRVKGTDKEWTYNPNAVNSNMKTYVNGKTDYGNSARIIAAPQDRYSNAKVQGFDVPGLVTLRSIEDFGNVGVKFTTKATYLGNVVPLNVVFMSGEEARDSEFETYTTNGEAFELFGETSNSNTVSSYKVLDNWLEYNGQDHSGNSADWKARFDGRYWANIATEDSLKTAKQSAFYRKGQPTKVVDGIGTKVFGPVSNHLDSGFSTPIIMTKNASEVGMYIMSTGRQSAMIGVALLDYGDAPDSYGSGAHSINFNEADRQPYLGSKPADIDFIPEGIPNGSVPWYRDELINQFDEGPEQLMGSAVESGVNYTLHHSNNGTYALRFTANTNNNDRAYVQGWIDFNNDGRFDESENSGILEVVRGKTEYTLNFKDIYQNVDTSVTKLGVRMRIALDAVDIITPDLTAYSGEVEDFQIQMTHPPRGTKKETIASQGETQTGTVEFFAYGQNTYETTLAKIDEAVPPSIVKENGQLVQDSELVDGYYVVPGEGRYKITGNGKDVNVEFIPEPGFVTRLSDGSIIKQAKGITIRRTSTVLNQEGTAAYTTGWTATTDVHGIANISEQTNTMDGRYIPHVVAVVPSGVDATSSAVQGAVQTGRPTFVPGTISTGAQVPMDPNTTKLLDDSSNPVDVTTAYAMVNGVRTAVGEYRISSTDGTVTYTPNDEGKRFIGSLLPVTVQSKDINGSAATATYTPTITPITPTAQAATSVGIQGKEQTGTPTFEKAPTAPEGVAELDPASLKFVDALGNPLLDESDVPVTSVKVPDQGTYTLNADGSITFKPLPEFVGTPTPVHVQMSDTNGTPVTTTYAPVVVEVKPVADPDESFGLKGEKQTSTPDFFVAGQVDLNGDKTYDPATEVVDLDPATLTLLDASGNPVTSVEVPGQGTYTLNTDGSVTFTPLPDFVGKATPVSIQIKDKNGTPVTTTYTPTVVEVPESELKESVTRTINYVYADNSPVTVDKDGAPVAPLEHTVSFTRTAIADPETGEIRYTEWTPVGDTTAFPEVTSPLLNNFTPDKAVVPADTTVSGDDADETITVIYRENDKQLATITYKAKVGTETVELSKEGTEGHPGDAIDFLNSPQKIADFEKLGYMVESNAFADATDPTFDDQPGVQNFDVILVPKTTTIKPQDPSDPDNPTNPKPGDPVDPNNPDGPKWEDVSRTITRKVSYVVESPEGETVTAPEGKTTTVTFERTGSYNFVTKQVTYTDWEAKDGDAVLEGNPLPVIDGYVAIAATKNGDKVEASTTAEDVTATETTTDISEVVTYKKLSSWTVTPPPGNDPVPDIPYENDPNDPTKPADPKPTRPNEEDPNNPIPTVPDYPGYVPVDPDGNELPKDDDGNYIPPTPKDPSQPTPITYKPVEQVGKISFVDVTVPENPVTKVTIDLSGKTGDKLGMDVSSIVTKYENLGYIVTNKDNYDKDGTFGPDLKSNTFVYELVERTVNIDPDDPNTPTPKPGEPVDPNNPDGPKWPDSVRDLVTTEEVTRTISYVDTKGNTVFEEIKETKTFKRTAKVNIVTGAITYGDWSADQTFEKVTSPLKDNHLVDKLEVPASTVKAEDEDINEVVTYTLLGQWKPVVPPGTKPVPPVTYPRDPEDPTKPGTEVPTIPAIPGTIPVYPDPNNPGQTIPLEPSPDGGYELPPVPSKPGEDTVIEYVPNTVSLTVKYVDDTGADLRPTESKEVKVGDDYTTTPQVIEGYYLTEIPANSKGKVGAEGTTVVYVYNKLGSWVPELPEGHDPVPPIPYPNHPTDPGKPGIPTGVVPVVPGYIPVGPDGKELPKGPDGNYLPPVPSKPGEDTVIKYIPQDASVTVRYVDDKGNDLIPSKSIPGKVGDDYTTTPEIIKGYLLKEVPSNASGKIPAGGTSVVYTYVPIGSYVPNIPGQPSTPIPYPNHPTDPGKPGTDLPSIPHVPGYIPVGPGGVPLQPVDPSDPTKGYIAPPIPGNPGQDTPINYIPSPPARPSRPIVVTPVKPETPVEPEVPTTPAQPSPAGPAQPASPGTAQLPNTGTSDSHAVTVIGASLFLAALAIAGTARRREE